MNKYKSRIVVLFSLLVILLTGCIKDRTPIRIGTNAWPPCEIWYTAEQQGMFKTVPVEMKRFSSWTDNMSSLYKGNIDITHATYFNAVYFHDKGEAGTVILASDTIKGSDGLVVKKNMLNGLELAPDKLRGKALAVEIHTDEHFLLKKALDVYGLREEELELRSMTSYEASKAFIEGDVDAAFVYEPFLSEAASEGGGMIVWTTEELPGYMIDVLVVRNKVLENRKKEIVQIISAWYEAQDYILSDGGEAFALMAEKEDMPPDAFEAFYRGFTFFTPEDNLEIFGSATFISRLEEMNDFLLEHNAISRKADIGGLFSSEIVSEIME